MTVLEAKAEIPDIDQFCRWACLYCTGNDWYCPSECELLLKARRLDFVRILKSYARNEGDPQKVFRFIKQAKA